jgi:K+-transporting ATPase ATPase C chain
MHQREGRASLVLGMLQSLGIASESLGQELDGDRAAKTGVFGELDPAGRVPTTSLRLIYDFLRPGALLYTRSVSMSDSGASAEGKPVRAALPASRAKLSTQLRPALLSVLVLTVLTGCVFPLLLYAIGRPLFPHQAAGSLVASGNTIIGSDLIGQVFARPEYFHPRPSAAGNGYDATASGGTNLGPNNPKLTSGAADFAGIRQLAAEYRKRNGLAEDTPIPIDAVTRSGSGLDPDISPANAALQTSRVARARGVSEETVRRLVLEHTKGPQLGFLGYPRVVVLELNLALDQAFKPAASMTSR